MELPDNVTLAPREQVEDYLATLLRDGVDDNMLVLVTPDAVQTEGVMQILKMLHSEAYLDTNQETVMCCYLDGDPMAFIVMMMLGASLNKVSPEMVVVVPKSEMSCALFAEWGADMELSNILMADQPDGAHTPPRMYVNAVDMFDPIAAARLRARGPRYNEIDGPEAES
jgi:hypothetical protein